ncbi:BTAD domain-containing putative transcriptional regulator [Aeromicrobium terrae]|uniref:AfsR/SARP family transcriptional regulator n=1 Tax=Aeromicrobium terrae TaxID=2498846 RepID=A0A5C8NEG9_9ACTN|nr:BTAD domain-containing putative transcriptional regulator [Aeromicrobium terrae]TXL57255.1 AfsR/SARP family transcriptional regulator [Aeromicrobium terrae]
MRVELLGPLRVLDGGAEVDLGGALNRALVARLALEPGRPVSTTTLVDDLWEDPPSANALQSVVSRTRRRLPDGALTSSAAGYALDVDEVDAAELERAVSSGDAASALRLWRGDPLADVDAPFADAVASRLSELRLGAVEASMRERAGAPDAALVAELADLTAAHPYREGLWNIYLQVLAALGHQAEALAAYERLRSCLAEDLGADPSPELQATHVALLRGDVVPQRRSADRLPVGLTTFVGRDDDVAQIVDALDAYRLVTVVGPGGAGKTRLSVEAARASRHDDVWPVELAAITNDEDVVPAVLAAMGLLEVTAVDRRRAGSSQDSKDRLLEAVADAHGLLLLDNCEHLVDTVAQVTEDVLRHAPGIVVLATSREPLGLVGELTYALEPLSIPESGVSAEQAAKHSAVDLFVQRAQAVDRAFVLDESTVSGVVEVCQRLDGQPLALELAAARLRTLTVDQVAARLSDRFRLLTGGSRTALPRHRTLRAVVEWSWDLLDEDERDLAERLAVFPGGVDADGASAVLGRDAAELLESLVDKSLLVPVRGPQPRFRMLETLREFGVERLLERGIVTEVRSAHLDHYLHLAEAAEPDLHGPDQLEALAMLDRDAGNLLAALRFAVDEQDRGRAGRLAAVFAWWWGIRGQETNFRTWMELIEGLPGTADPSTEVAINALGIIAAFEKDRDSVAPRIERALAAYDTGEAHGRLVDMAVAAFEFFGATGDRVIPEPEDPWTRAATRLMRGALLENAGEPENSVALLDQALEDLRAVGDRWGIAMAASQRASYEGQIGKLDDALDSMNEAIPLLEQLGATDDATFTRQRMLSLRLSSATPDDLPALRAEVERQVAASSETGDARASQLWRLNLAQVERLSGNTGAAVELLQGLVADIGEITEGIPGSSQMRAVIRAALAVGLVDDGKLDRARQELAAATSFATESEDMPVVSSVGVAAAVLAHAEGDPGRAARLLGAADNIRGRGDLSNRDDRELSERLRVELGNDAFEAERARGEGLDRVEALALVRAVSG